jgi:flagella basal body P-ring formation protein FlgA
MTVLECRMKSSLSADDVMAVSRSMTGWICGGMKTIGLCAAVMFAASDTGTAVASTAKLDGVDVSRLIVQKLAGQGLEGAPVIKPDRLFPACETKPKIEPMFGSWNTVSVRCESGSGWRFMVRTKLTSRVVPVPIRDFKPGVAKIGLVKNLAIEQAMARGNAAAAIADEIEVVGLARSVSRNDMIAAADLVMVAVSERNLLGAFFDPSDVIGRRAKIGVGVNQPLMAHHLYPDYLVEEGNEVVISSYAGGISVDMVGYAVENGQIGEWIGVENASSGKMVRGKITGEKKVSVITKK